MLVLEKIDFFLETSSCQKRKSTPERFFGQNERLVETKRKKNDSTPEILHKVALILPRNVGGVDFGWPG